MGHSRDDKASLYRERIDDDRLKAVTDHVHKWLFGENSDAVNSVQPAEKKDDLQHPRLLSYVFFAEPKRPTPTVDAMIQAIEIQLELKPVIRTNAGSNPNLGDWSGCIWTADALFSGETASKSAVPVVHASWVTPGASAASVIGWPLFSVGTRKVDSAVSYYTPTTCVVS